MKRFALLSVAVLSWVLGASMLEASILSNKLTYDGGLGWAQPNGEPEQNGGEDMLKDDSVSQIVRGSGSTGPGYAVGDIIWGVLTLSDVESSGGLNTDLPPGRIAFVFSAKIATAVANLFTLAPINDITSAYDLRNLIDGSVQNGLGGDTILTALSSANDAVGNNPLNWSTTDYTGGVKKFSAANGWGWELTAGMVSSQDFFEFEAGSTTSTAGTDRGGLTITSSAFNPGWALVDVHDFAGTTHYSQLTLDVGTVQIASADQQTRGWSLRDNSTLYVNPLPEPSAMLTWLGLASVSALLIARRRRLA